MELPVFLLEGIIIFLADILEKKKETILKNTRYCIFSILFIN